MKAFLENLFHFVYFGFLFAEVSVHFFFDFIGNLALDGEVSGVYRSLGEFKCKACRSCEHSGVYLSDNVVSCVNRRRAGSRRADKVYCGNAFVREGDTVGGVDIVFNLRSVAYFLLHEVDGVADRNVARNSYAVKAEQGTGHINVYAKSVFGKLVFMSGYVRFTAEQASFFGAAENEFKRTKGRIFCKVTEEF